MTESGLRSHAWGVRQPRRADTPSVPRSILYANSAETGLRGASRLPRWSGVTPSFPARPNRALHRIGACLGGGRRRRSEPFMSPSTDFRVHLVLASASLCGLRAFSASSHSQWRGRPRYGQTESPARVRLSVVYRLPLGRFVSAKQALDPSAIRGTPRLRGPQPKLIGRLRVEAAVCSAGAAKSLARRMSWKPT